LSKRPVKFLECFVHVRQRDGCESFGVVA
jgi:hypothetical protein